MNGGQYLAGCAIEIGQRGCTVNYPKGVALSQGDKLVVIIGEAGNVDARGDYSADWWFTARPDS